MGRILGEAPAQELRDYITDNAASKLADVAYRDEYAGQYLDLPNFTEDMNGNRARMYEPPDNPEPAYPVLYIRPVRAAFRPGVSGLASSGITEAQYMVAVVCDDALSPERAILACMRYMVAVLEMMAECYSPADGRVYEWGMVSDTAVEYQPLFTTERGYFADTRILVSTQFSEDAL